MHARDGKTDAGPATSRKASTPILPPRWNPHAAKQFGKPPVVYLLQSFPSKRHFSSALIHSPIPRPPSAPKHKPSLVPSLESATSSLPSTDDDVDRPSPPWVFPRYTPQYNPGGTWHAISLSPTTGKTARILQPDLSPAPNSRKQDPKPNTTLSLSSATPKPRFPHHTVTIGHLPPKEK